jgi:phage minor structural protein, N-terminal domain protein|nr:MAG TPA: minor structural protein [Caudoviricetes sp.]
MYVLTYAGNTIHDPREEGVQISAGKLVEESGQSPTLSFTVQPTHPLWRAFNRESVMNTEREIELTEHETQKILFRGRIRKVSMSMNGSIDVTCEGAMAYLNDTTVRPYKTYDTDEIDCEINAPAKAGELFEWFIEQHNLRVSNRCEKFKVGINAGVNFGALQRGTGTRPTTLKEMREKLTKLCGGYFRVRYVGEDNYLDWLNADGSSEAAQSVELGQNLLDLNTGADGKDIYTAIVPVGKTGEGEDEKDVTIDDEHAYVGGGYDIVGDAVVDTAMAERYGVIEKLMEYDHLNQPQALADKAVADLAAGKLSDSITVSATDLHYADATIQQIDYLQRVQVTSEPHGINRMMLCVGRTINLVDPKATRYSFGAIEGTLTKSGTTSQERTQEATEKRLTALASTTRKTVEDTHKTTVKVQAVEEKAVAVEKKADAATEKIAEVATTATAAAEKVETVAAKAEKAAEEVSHVATDAKNATTTAKEAKTIATEAQSDANEVKSTVANLTNTFSHDADGAHVGDKAGMHTTIDAQGMKLLNGTKQLAAFDAGMVTLGGTALNIVAGYSNGRDDRRSTALFASDLLLKPTTSFDVEAQYTGLRITNADRMNTTAISTNWDSFSVSTNNGANKANITFNDLVKLLKFVPWTDLVNNSSVRVRYCVRGGVMYLDCFLTGGYPTYTTTAQIPSDLLPSNAAYYSLGTQNSNNTAKIWLGAAGGGDGHVYFYNYDSGYCSGVISIIPKSLE